ncbi:DUF5668 domain-containing protein [candidate division WOR-3 bacterium]|nr:DUF5668 domain-containing protein [candidate division WOR-3 bacterium]
MWRRNTVFWGLIFLTVGILIWISNFGIISLSWQRDWPVILIIIGIYKLATLIPIRKRKEVQKEIENPQKDGNG